MLGMNGLGRDTTTVLLCDLQKQIVARSKTTDPKSLGKSAEVLVELAKLFSLPLVLSVVPEQEKAPELIPELAHGTEGAKQILRTSASPFFDAVSRDEIEHFGRKTLIIGGFATEVVVLHSVLGALERGYRVLVAVDVCGGMSERTEQAAFRQIESAGAVTTSVVSLATALAPDFTTDEGKKMFALLQQLRLS